MRPEPRAVLRVGPRVIRKTAKTLVAADSGQVPPVGVDDVEDTLDVRTISTQPPPLPDHRTTHPIVRELHARDHHNAPVARVPVVVADETALGGRALALGDARHAEADVRGRVERRGVEDRDPVPAGLHLDRQVLQEALLRGPVLEDGLEGRVLERGAVDVARDPVVVEDRRALSA